MTYPDRRLEAAVLDPCRRAGTTPAGLDLRVWRAYSGNGEDPRALVRELKKLPKPEPVRAS